MARTTPYALGLALVAGLSISACGSDDKDPDPNPNPNPTDTVKVDAFAATPTTVAPGQSTTLTWAVSGTAGLSVKIEATPGGEVTTSTMLAGSVTSAAINANTTFKLTVSKGAATASREVSVTVDANAVAIGTFTANPAMPARGGQVTLGWTTSNATSVEIFEGATSRFTSTTMVASGTAMIPVPNATHTFRLVATNGAMMAERTLTVNTTAPVGEVEPNNDPATAQVLTGGMTMGSVSPADDVDYYRITVPANGNVRAETSDGAGGCNFDTIVTLFAPDGTTQVATNDDGGEGLCSLLDPTTNADLTNLGAGDYYLAVEAVGTATGAYTLTVAIGAAGCGNGIFETGEVCDDGNTTAGDGCSPTCQVEIAGTITPPGGSVNLTVDTFNEQNPPLPKFVAVTITEGQSITATTSDGAGDCPLGTWIALFNQDFTERLGLVNGNGGCAAFDARTSRFAANLPAGTYHIGVEADAAGGQVTLTVSIVNPECGNGIRDVRGVTPPEPCDDGNADDSDSCTAACTINYAGTVTGAFPQTGLFSNQIDPSSEVDYFQIVMPGEGYIRARTGAPVIDDCSATGANDTVLELYDSAGVQVARNDDFGGPCSFLDPVNLPELRVPAGTYTLQVISFNNSQVIPAYQLEIRTIPADVCGNIILEGTERCDDGNTSNGDGCSSTCEFEATPIAATIGGAFVTVSGALAVNEIDTYSVVIPNGMTATVEALTYTTQGMPSLGCMDPEDTVLSLLSDTFQELASNDDIDFAGDNLCSSLVGESGAASLPAGTYYLQVRPYQGLSLANYYLDVRLVP